MSVSERERERLSECVSERGAVERWGETHVGRRAVLDDARVRVRDREGESESEEVSE